MSKKLYRIISPYFVCAIGTNKDRIDFAAPIVKYMTGWHINKIKQYCAKKKWTCEEIDYDRN